jgi:hypothetical protein
VSEQAHDHNKMGVHTARYARAVSMYNQARYGGNNATLTDWAFRAWNWASYMVLDDGLAVVGPAASNNLWCVWLMLSHLVRCHVCKFCLFSRFRIQAAAVMDMMHAMRYIHYWQPVADHLLEFTCAPTAVSFTSKNISYNVSCGAAVETLKVTFDPASVKAGTKALKRRNAPTMATQNIQGSEDYYEFDAASGLLTISHASQGGIRIMG